MGSSAAFAHDPGLSSANVELRSDRVDVVLTFNERDIAGVAGVPAETVRERGANLPAQVRALLDRAVLLELDGAAVKPSASNASAQADNNVEFQFTFPFGGRAAELTFRSLLLEDLPFGHRQAFAIRDATGRELSRSLLSARDYAARLALDAATAEPVPTGFIEFLRLGIHHILTGYDHLLFLFGLLVMCRSGRNAALLITCFTVGHSLTLGLSTFGLVNLPSRLVEAAIAGSILYVGIENLFRREQPIRGRALLTLAFGLVHGLGFASVLRELGVAESGAAALVPLMAFNTGVELGQLSVAAIVLPVVWLLRRNDNFIRVGVPVGSLVVALAGGFWLLDRTMF
jgi:hydrogenase/urease accessory protein HupE